MITPHLEKLIFEGKAQYKTFVGGYAQKHILNIPQNRYIIITDLWYTPSLFFDPNAVGNNHFSEYKKYLITQLTILGNRGFNRFLFKNSIFFSFKDQNYKEQETYTPNNPTHISTYLIHTDGVSLTFSNQDTINASSNAFAPVNVPALQNPGDYGKLGIPGSQAPTDRYVTLTGYENKFFNEDLVPGALGNNEYSYPVNGITNLVDTVRTEEISYPILNIGYVEILGQPDKMGY